MKFISWDPKSLPRDRELRKIESSRVNLLRYIGKISGPGFHFERSRTSRDRSSSYRGSSVKDCAISKCRVS
jgi:hypothetical protein